MKAIAKFIRFSSIVILFLFAYTSLQGQSPRIKATYFGGNVVNKGDTVQVSLTAYRGDIQWQKSLNAQEWIDIEEQTKNQLAYRIDTNLFFRAKVKDGNCDPVFSDTLSFVAQVLNDNVLIIDPQKTELISDSLDLSKGVYRYKADSNPGINPGDVLVGKEGEGYIRVVDQIDQQGNEYIYTTVQGTVEDVIQEIMFQDSVLLTMDGTQPKPVSVNGIDVPVQIIYQEPGVTLKSGGGISLKDIVLIDKKIGENAQVLAKINTGNISFTPTFNQELLIRWAKVQKFSASATGQLAFSCGLEVSCTYEFKYEPNKTLLEYRIGPIMIGSYIPVFINIGFDVGAEFSFDAYGKFEMGFDAQYTPTFGATYTRSADPLWSPIWIVDKSYGAKPPSLDIGADLEAKLYIKPWIAVTVACLAGPYLEVVPYLRGEAHVKLPEWDYGLYAGIESNLGFKLSFLSYDLFNYSKSLGGKEWTILSGSGTNPSVSTLNAKDITKSSATLSGEVTSNGGTPISKRGICWGSSSRPNLLDNVIWLGTGTGSFSTTLTGLKEKTTYYYRAFATNLSGIGWGEDKTFFTVDPVLPTVSTSNVSDIQQTSAICGGSVTSGGGSNVSSRGVCWNTSGTPTISDFKTNDGTGTGSFTSFLAGLTAGTTHYVRAYATNSAGTAYGEQKEFETKGAGSTFTDSRDGHVYKYLTIGSQVWMAENLAYLPFVSPSSSGSDASAYYYVYGYDGDIVNAAKANANYVTYGVLYNSPAASSACPAGWHLPSDGEWKVLTDYLTNNGFGYGGSGNDIAKSMASTAGWTSSSTAGTIGNNQSTNNSSGFNIVPGGNRSYVGGFGLMGNKASFWSSNGSFALHLEYLNDYVRLHMDNGFREGFSVRCLKN